MTLGMSGRPGRLIGKAIYSLALVGVLSYSAIFLNAQNREFWGKLIDFSPRHVIFVVVGSALLVPFLDWMDLSLAGRRRWLDWSLFRRNINFVPMDYPILRVPFLALLYFNLPVLAWVEEMIFRHNWVFHPTSGWIDAFWRSILFGVLHVGAGAKLRTSAPLTMGGLWFSWHYFQGGVTAATLAHLAMNTTGLTLMLVSWIRTGRNPFSD
jgi:hypothetical protein